MRYKIRSLRNFKRRNIFKTYEPGKRSGINKENAVPFLFKIGHESSHLGGWIGLWASGVLMAIESFFGIKKKIKNFSFNKKMIEIRIKKR